MLFCLIMAAVGRGMGDTYAIFLLPFGQDLGWDRSNIASIYAVYIGAMGFSRHCLDIFLIVSAVALFMFLGFSSGAVIGLRET